jgi:hypothetical protein
LYPKQERIKRFTTPPAEPVAEVTNTDTAAQSTEPVVQEPIEVVPVQPSSQEQIKPDEFIENLNKEYGTQFKSKDEFKGIFELPKKVTEYEGRLKEAEGWKAQNEQYQKQIEEMKNAGNSEFLSKPLVQKAYVAEQLLAKYPDKDPFVLQEIAMTDVSKLSDLDALVKNEKMDLPDASEADIKSHFLDKYGLDPDTPPAEWSSVAKTRMAIDAKSARANIRSLTTGIELPKAVSKEDREKVAAESLQNTGCRAIQE